MKQYYYTNTKNEQEGPINEDVLIEGFKAGSYSNQTRVWCEGMQDWESLTSVMTAQGITAPLRTPPPLTKPKENLNAGSHSNLSTSVENISRTLEQVVGKTKNAANELINKNRSSEEPKGQTEKASKGKPSVSEIAIATVITFVVLLIMANTMEPSALNSDKSGLYRIFSLITQINYLGAFIISPIIGYIWASYFASEDEKKSIVPRVFGTAVIVAIGSIIFHAQ